MCWSGWPRDHGHGGMCPATSLVTGVINALAAKQALIMEWNSDLYIVQGVTYGTSYSAEGAENGFDLQNISSGPAILRPAP